MKCIYLQTVVLLRLVFIQIMSEDDKIQFVPPLYMQRYSKVLDILSKERPEKVIDFGCAECKLIQLLKSEEYLEEICGVDVDRSLLDGARWKIGPLTVDYIYPRTKRLTVKLLHGSVLTPTPALLHFDAVTCIELVEHLQPEMLPDLTKNIFGFIQPKLVIISTPNADFNVLFSNGTKLRHWDHKFEWTAKEFENWCHEICGQFNYSVDFDGVGIAPEKKHLGYCSQFAIFHKIDKISQGIHKNGVVNGEAHAFETVAVSIHPFASAETRLEKQFYAKFYSYVNSIVSVCKIMLSSIEDDKPVINSLQRMFMHLRLSNPNRCAQFQNMRKETFPHLNPEQFADALEHGSQDYSINIYGQKRFLVVVEPLNSTHNYLQKLKDAYIKSCNILPAPGQFDDCETDSTSSQSELFLKRRTVIAQSDKIVDLSKYNSDMQFSVRITDISMAEDCKDGENLVLYKISNVLKVPLLLLTKLDETKSFEFDEIKIENIINKEKPEGIELRHEGKKSYVIIDMEVPNCLDRSRRWSRDSDSILSDSSSWKSSSLAAVCNDEEFSEENWDSS